MTKPTREFLALAARVPGTAREALRTELQALCDHFGVKALPPYNTGQGKHWAEKRSKSKAFVVECRGAGGRLATHDEVCAKFGLAPAGLAKLLKHHKGVFNRQVDDDIFTVTRL